MNACLCNGCFIVFTLINISVLAIDTHSCTIARTHMKANKQTCVRMLTFLRSNIDLWYFKYQFRQEQERHFLKYNIRKVSQSNSIHCLHLSIHPSISWKSNLLIIVIKQVKKKIENKLFAFVCSNVCCC